MFVKYLRDEEGMGTVELVLIIAALVSIAIIFRKYVIDFVQKQLGNIFNNSEVTNSVTTETSAAQ
ncbi:MAG: hypothetical protein IKP66_04800 [Lachnospiraceae bacterium]|nr:hypothetical protein [Lachnospiraceae bacterium]